MQGELAGEGRLPADPDRAAALIDDEVRERVRASGKTNLGRAVTELVNAGLLKRLSSTRFEWADHEGCVAHNNTCHCPPR